MQRNECERSRTPRRYARACASHTAYGAAHMRSVHFQNFGDQQQARARPGKAQPNRGYVGARRRRRHRFPLVFRVRASEFSSIARQTFAIT